jgi:LysM repeat protein
MRRPVAFLLTLIFAVLLAAAFQIGTPASAQDPTPTRAVRATITPTPRVTQAAPTATETKAAEPTTDVLATVNAQQTVFAQTLITQTATIVPVDSGGTGGEAITPEQQQSGVREADRSYIVQPGDTIDLIAQAFDVSAQAITIYNDIENTRLLLPGTVLLIPAGAPAYGLFPALDENGELILDLGGGGGGGGQYIVQPGDTLDVIAQSFDISVVSLAVLNDIDVNDPLLPGTLLLLPDDGVVYGQYPPLTDAQGNPIASGAASGGAAGGGGVDLGTGGAEMQTYTVQEGDTYPSIAQRFGVELSALLQVNTIAALTPTPGDVLNIPPTGGAITDNTAGQGGGTFTLPENSYIVQPNDNLDLIAQRFNVSIVSLRAENGLTERTTLRPGMVLIIPQGAPPYGEFPPIDSSGNVISPESLGVGGGGGDSDIVVLQPGETLDGIAQLYNVSLVSLLQANGIAEGRTLPPGTVVVIPLSAPPYGSYPALTDAQGNPIGTGSQIVGGAAGGGGSSPDLSGNRADLVVTFTPNAPGGETFLVRTGDTLSRIASDYGISLECLAEYNSIEDPDVLYAGQRITIPNICIQQSGGN